VDEVPLTPSQKIQRGELKTLASGVLGLPHCVNTTAMKKRR